MLDSHESVDTRCFAGMDYKNDVSSRTFIKNCGIPCFVAHKRCTEAGLRSRVADLQLVNGGCQSTDAACRETETEGVLYAGRVLGFFQNPAHLFYRAVHVFPSFKRCDHHSLSDLLFSAILGIFGGRWIYYFRPFSPFLEGGRFIIFGHFGCCFRRAVDFLSSAVLAIFAGW